MAVLSLEFAVTVRKLLLANLLCLDAVTRMLVASECVVLGESAVDPMPVNVSTAERREDPLARRSPSERARLVGGPWRVRALIQRDHMGIMSFVIINSSKAIRLDLFVDGWNERKKLDGTRLAWLAKSRIFYDGDINFTCLRFCFNTVVKIASVKVKNHVRFVSEEKRFTRQGLLGWRSDCSKFLSQPFY